MTPVRAGAEHSALEAALATLAGHFADAGFAPVTAVHLFEAEALIDLYGEDIRARAFLIPGSGGGGELCLRPDFTVPVVRAHGAGGWGRRARYAYQGPVFRRQPPGSTRSSEYVQAGIEDLGNPDRAEADAQVLGLILRGLAALGAGKLAVTTGDLGIAFALLDALPMPGRRRHQLRRHFWRPRRFHALIEEAVAGPAASTPSRARLLEAASGAAPADAIASLATEAGEPVGLREIDEIVARALALAEAAGDPPMPRAEAELIEAALAIRGPAANALARLRALTAGAGVSIAPALDRFEARLAALDRAGIDAAALAFDAAFGRNLEYYEGFVFEIAAEGRPDSPPLAGGGRYDVMTRRLGAAGPVPAVGAMIRPEAVLAAKDTPPDATPDAPPDTRPEATR
ncbi:MAG TPA: ATP phosphoribosyltransferase regulatory subunit [Thermohalobaculum sp.]|nr:ATP phosphoribosyltransferase regulatory subunit [Thermohalobaculum sp.]